MAQPLLLTYNLKSDTAARLDRICRNLGIRVRSVTPGEYALPIGALAGIPVRGTADPVATPTKPFDDEMLVMCHMMSNRLNAFLKAMREEGIPRIDLKAVLTPVNVAWDSTDLHGELTREHGELTREHNEIQRRNR